MTAVTITRDSGHSAATRARGKLSLRQDCGERRSIRRAWVNWPGDRAVRAQPVANFILARRRKTAEAMIHGIRDQPASKPNSLPVAARQAVNHRSMPTKGEGP